LSLKILKSFDFGTQAPHNPAHRLILAGPPSKFEFFSRLFFQKTQTVNCVRKRGHSRQNSINQTSITERATKRYTRKRKRHECCSE
jgi:hypothetical protein